MEEKYVRVVQGTMRIVSSEVCSKSDRWVQGVGGITLLNYDVCN